LAGDRRGGAGVSDPIKFISHGYDPGGKDRTVAVLIHADGRVEDIREDFGSQWADSLPAGLKRVEEISFSGTFDIRPPSQVGKPVKFEGVRLGTISEDDRCGNWKVKNEATPEQVDQMFRNQRRRFNRERSVYWKRYVRRARHVRHRRTVR
jgi:hypothetical protein